MNDATLYHVMRWNVTNFRKFPVPVVLTAELKKKSTFRRIEW